ncbi:MAG: nitrate- and nitrite sensing domain-containing protein [Rhodospirillaceae bacterium]|nr:nitrate- and nitrite sensing domain-containing protein [Rhodospirillaceae bacterium]
MGGASLLNALWKKRLLNPLPVTVAVMLGLSLLVINNEVREWRSADTIVQNSRFISVISNFVHELQIERGLSALYIGAKSLQVAENLNNQKKATDHNLVDFSKLLSNKTDPSDKQLSSLQVRISNILQQLGSVRRDTITDATAADASFTYYSKLIKNLLLLQLELSHGVTIIELHEQITIIRDIALLKEMAGQARALGSEAFSSGSISNKQYSHIFNLISDKNDRLSEIHLIATPMQRGVLSDNLSEDKIKEASQIQDFLLDDGLDGKLQKSYALPWFNIMTAYIDKIKKVEDVFSNHLLLASNKMINKIKLKLLLLVGVLFLVLALMITWMWRSEKKAISFTDDLQDSLRAEQERSQKILEAMSDAVCVVDRDGNIEFANPAMVEAFGDNMWEKKAVDILPCANPKDCALTSQGLDWSEGKFCKVTSPITNRSYDVNCTPFHGKQRSDSWLVVLTDVTSHVLTEQRLQEAKDAAESANQTKSEILANMSHELRTPLNAIIGFSDVMLNNIFGSLNNDRYSECARDIHSSGMHLLELINDILDVSAIEAGKVELQSEDMVVSDIINSAMRLIRPQANEGYISLYADIDDDMPMLRGDVRRMKQVMLNLMSNAVKFTTKGGSVTVSSSCGDDGTIRISVEDTGIGMDEKGIEKAMERFGQVDSGLDRRHQGTGLGLPLVQGLIELHGGTLNMDSVEGEGTTATIILPAHRVIIDTELGDALA